MGATPPLEQSNGSSDPPAVFDRLFDWAIGALLGIAGLLSALVGAAVVVAHGRARRDDRPTPRWILGVVGAMVGTLLAFVPLSPALGGAAAGYLDPDPAASGLGVGTIAGLFAALPAVVLTLSVGAGLVDGLRPGLVPAAMAVLAAAVLCSLVYLVGLSAVDGYLGRRVQDS